MRIDDERQILSPSKLFPGAQIAVLQVFPGASPKERLIQAAASLTGMIGDQTGGRIQAAKRGWNHRGLQGVAPMYVGSVEDVHSSRVQIAITAEPDGDGGSIAFIGEDADMLPTLSYPRTRITDFSELGLAAIQPPSHRYFPELPVANVGRWEPHVTILLH